MSRKIAEGVDNGLSQLQHPGMGNPDLTDDPSQHQMSPVEEARAQAQQPRTPQRDTRPAELEAFRRLLDRTEGEYGMVCDLALKLGCAPNVVADARERLEAGLRELRRSMPEGA